ncbi:MAG: SDR family NAD(P)-dependent oxidoreductase [Dehalococcoidales bacterium]|jgi:NAD(P)-dependent dehydrogenase (short-subunit alcohol dehydrogenase family)|nr:SDR family NAD(P)-dependent oxidoreductase [Dehalococcoidales bacterium]MDD5402533.1 SDR family NAD(P)-dependent oxidoreductase [Dehalococcoidales bacterium]
MTNQERAALYSQIDLTGRVAVVTGGAQGIGLVICSHLADAGARVVIADYNQAAGKQAVQALNKTGASFVCCNVADELQVQKMVAETLEAENRIDILVNNAGIYPQKPLLEMTGNDFRHVLEVNLVGTFLCSRYVAASMVENRCGGTIINMASIEAERSSSEGMSAYGASKAGVVMLTRSLAGELGKYGIRVNAVSPGGIITQEMASKVNQADNQNRRIQYSRLKEFLKRVPLGRMGEADDVARAVLFLASDMSSYINGETIKVDGGYMVS